MMRVKTLVFVVFMAIAARTATAAPITFTFTTAGAGTLAKSDGTDVNFDLSTLIEVTLVADTSQLQNPLIPYGNGGNPLPGVIGYGVGTTVSASLSLAGVSMGALANPTYLFRNGNLVGFGDSVDFDIFGVSSAALAGYMLDSTFGPTSGFPYFPGVTHIALASGDTVTLTDLSEAYGATFSAAATPAVPEPATLSLLLIGLAALPFRRTVRRARP
jgi:hypothetical protein